jgi:hypothetical protein
MLPRPHAVSHVPHNRACAVLHQHEPVCPVRGAGTAAETRCGVLRDAHARAQLFVHAVYREHCAQRCDKRSSSSFAVSFLKFCRKRCFIKTGSGQPPGKTLQQRGRFTLSGAHPISSITPVESQAPGCGSVAAWTGGTAFPLPYKTTFEEEQVKFRDFAEYLSDMQGIFRVVSDPFADDDADDDAER